MERTPGSDAFTLIELLVVVAIISLLVTILLPSLQQAKELGRRTVCMGGMRGSGLALSMYHSDSNGWMAGGGNIGGVPGHWASQLTGAKVMEHWYEWKDSCPSNQVSPTSDYGPAVGGPGTGGMCAGGVTTAAGHPVPHLCRITLVDTPSDIPYFGEMYDGDGGWHWCIDIGHTMGGYLWKLYNDLHLDSSNALFVGGNVLSVRSEVWTRANSFYPNWYYSFSINHPKYDW